MNETSFLSALRGLMRIESVRSYPEGAYPYGAGCGRALDYMLALGADMGFRTKNCGGEVGYIETGEGEELVGILAHLDTVPAGDVGKWRFPPFDLTEENGVLVGRGVIDDKGPAMAALFAMKAVKESGRKFTRRVRLILGQTEENGDWTDMDYYCRNEELPTFGFTPDADFPVIYGEKGILHIDLVLPEESGVAVTGGVAPNVVPETCTAAFPDGTTLEKTGRAAHGSQPYNGDNAISHVMEALGNTTSVSRFFNEYIGFDLHGERLGVDCADEESGRITLNVGMVRREGDRHVLTLDLRCPVTKDMNDVAERLNAVAVSAGGKAAVRGTQRPVYLDKNGTLVQTLLSVYRDATGDKTEPAVIGGGTYARAMEHIVAFGPMFPQREQTEHQINERVAKADLLLAERIYEEALFRLATE